MTEEERIKKEEIAWKKAKEGRLKIKIDSFED